MAVTGDAAATGALRWGGIGAFAGTALCGGIEPVTSAEATCRSMRSSRAVTSASLAEGSIR